MTFHLVPEDFLAHRVRRDRPCPVCGKPDWCLSDCETWALCQRVESSERWKSAGWLHRLQPSARKIAPPFQRRLECKASLPGRATPDSITAAYTYRDESGNAIYRKLRFDPQGGRKYFRFERFDGWDKSERPWRGRWIGGAGCMEGIRRVLYNLDLVIQEPSRRLFIVEGEKCSDLLWDFGILATCNDDGATQPGAAGKWRPDYSEALRGREVFIIPDNDEPGRHHARQIGEALHGIARRIKLVELPDLGPKEDVFDWLTLAGGSL